MRHLTTMLFTALCCAAAVLLMSCSSSTSTSDTFVMKGSAGSSRMSVRTPSGSPTRMDLTFYAVYISQNEDCTDAVLAGGDGTTAVTEDMVSSPTLLSGSPAAGTYHCLILKMKDNMVFRPDATAATAFPGVCDTTEDATFDIFRAGETGWKDKDGNDLTATGTVASPGPDTVYIFASTDTSAVTGGSIGASSNQVLALTDAFTIPATGVYTAWFTADFHNAVDDNSGHCWLEASPFTITGE